VSTTSSATTTTAPPSSASTNEATGLPPYTPPPPDGAGNPPCEFGVGWDTFYGEPDAPHGTRVVITKNGLPELTSHFIDLPDHYTVSVRTKDGRHVTQDASVGEGGTDKWDTVAEKDFNFLNVDPADVKDVLMTTSKGTCWVDGNP
jgi:hypothetical protein